MATQEQIDQVVAILRQLRPAPLFRTLNAPQMGIGAVIRYLQESEGEVTAGSIATFMGVSTARVAVLLKKMAAKGLIVKQTPATDGRVTIVRLSSAGEEMAQTMKAEVCNRLNQMIDRLGMERMLDFLGTIQEIADLAQENMPNLEELL